MHVSSLFCPSQHIVYYSYSCTYSMLFLLSFSIYTYVVLPPLFHTFHHVPLSDGCRICPLWQQNDTIQKFCLPHSSTFFCLVSVTLPSFSSFSLYVVPSFCPFLSTFVLARFCRYCQERKHRLNCCNNDKYTIPALKPVPPELMSTFRSTEFQRAQR